VLPDRLAAQLLTGPRARDPVAVATRLLAIQAQDLRGALLAIRARSTGFKRSAVERACSEDRSLVVTWLVRGTLHLVRSEDHAWLHSLTAPTTRAMNARRLAEEGVDADAADRGTRVIVDALTRHGPLTREQLRDHVDRAGVRTEGQALVHLLLRASLDGQVVRGPFVDGTQAYVLTRDWIGPAAAPPRERALAELARRYLAGHGPADDRDLAKWSGLPLRDARAALRATASELVDRGNGRVDLLGRGRRSRLPRPRLLGQFDPLLHGWRSRDDILGSHRDVVTVNGIFRPIALVDGIAAGTWSIQPAAVELRAFGVLPEVAVHALERDAADVLRYLGLARRPLHVMT
jgi:Winged helix DNA-binding domain